MTTRLRLAAAALLVGALAGCAREPDPFTVDADDVSVHFILVAGADSVQAIVERPGELIDAADVRLIAGPDTIPLVFSTPACAGFFGPNPPEGCHRARLQEPIAPGATYELLVLVQGEAPITGSTTVPEALGITAPAAGQRVTVHCNAEDTCYAQPLEEPPYGIPVVELTARWQEAVEVERLFGHIRPLRTFLGDDVYGRAEGCGLGFFGMFGFIFGDGGRAGVLTDSMRVEIPNITCPPPLDPALFDSIHAEVRIAVLNDQMLEYREVFGAGNSARADFLSIGLDGAWGIFGAMTPNPVPVTLVRDPAPAAAAAP